MKKIFILLFVSVCAFSQPQDYSKLKGEQLQKLCKEKDLEIENYKKEQEKLQKKLKELTETSDSKLQELKSLIADINRTFIRSIVEDLYVKNKTYFATTDLPDTKDDTPIINKYNLLLNSILITEKDLSFETTCKEALNFNENYLALFDIRKNVLGQKYDATLVNNALDKIKNLPALMPSSKLEATKTKISNNLANYQKRTCEIKAKLNRYIENPDQNALFKKNYTALQNSDLYKPYPYLVQIIENVKNDRNNYSDSSLQPCE